MPPVNQYKNIGHSGGLEWSRGQPGHCRTCNLRCWCACRGDGLRGGPRHVYHEGEQRPGKLGNRHQQYSEQGQQQHGGVGRGHPRHHRQWWRRQRLCCKRPGRTAIAIARAPTPALAWVVKVTGLGCNGEAVVVLVVSVFVTEVPGGGWGQRQPWADICIHVARLLKCVLGACQAVIGAAREWGGGGCHPCGEGGGDDDSNNIANNNNEGDIQEGGAAGSTTLLLYASSTTMCSTHPRVPSSTPRRWR
jgi:hypothetical protein